MHVAYRLRSLEPNDAEVVADLIRIAFAALPVALDPPPSALREKAEAVAGHIREGGGVGAVADDALVGALLWNPTDRGLYLSRVSVAPAWRRRGIAPAMLAWAEAFAAQAGHRRLWLSVRLALPANRRLFTSAGYVETEFHAHAGYTMPTFVDMERHLADGPAVGPPIC